MVIFSLINVEIAFEWLARFAHGSLEFVPLVDESVSPSSAFPPGLGVHSRCSLQGTHTVL